VATRTASKRSVGEVIAGRPRTVPTVRTGWKPVRFVKQLGKAAWDDNITDVAAMMAYYAVLALFPMIVFIVTIALLVLDPTTVHQGVLMVTEAMPESTRIFISNKVTNLIDAAGAGFAIGSVAFALWGASRGASALGCALNTIYNKTETRGFFHRQLISIAVTVGVAILMVIALSLLVVGPAAGHWFADRFGLGDAFDTAWSVGRWVGAGVLVMFVWAVVYKFLANTDAPFRVFTPGAFVGVILWLGISALFGVYLGHFNTYDATYGALGGAIIFLTWLWLSNMALLFGAEVNDVLADFRKHESDAAAQLSDPNEIPLTE
jgi:membrane protein